MISDELALDICRYVNAYIFQKIWSEPSCEYRRNISPKLLKQQSQVGTFFYQYRTINLPTIDDPYVMYAMPNYTFGGLVIEPEDWVSIEDFMRDNGKVSIRVHGSTGEWMHRNRVFIRYMEEDDVLLMAVDTKMMGHCWAQEAERRDLYVAIYYDSDQPNDRLLTCYQPTTNAEKTRAYNACLESDVTTVYINGNEAVPSSAEEIGTNSYVEILKDANVAYEFELDLADDDQNRVFLSTEDSCWKQIVHIPKSLNPDNEIITHHTCDVYIRPRNTSDKHLKGLFVHRCQGRENSFSQLTHNDFAIPMYIIDAYKAVLGVDEITMRVVVRHHSKDNFLIRDKNYMDLLYVHTDNQILDFLEGSPNPDLFEDLAGIDADSFYFWTADHLEQSKFTEMLEDIDEHVTLSDVESFVDALGYNHLLALICAKVKRYIVSPFLNKAFVVPTPMIFGTGPCYPQVFINGVKIPETEVSFVRSSVDCYMTIYLTEEVDMNEGDDLLIEFLGDKAYDTIVKEPDTGDDTVVINFDSFKLYEEQSTSIIYGVEMNSELVYHEITDLSTVGVLTQIGDDWEFQFHASEFGKKFVIQNENNIHRYVFNDVDDKITNNQPLVWELRQGIQGDTGNSVPLLQFQTIVVYFNGKAMVEGVDYHFVRRVDWRGDTSFIQLIVQNVDALQVSGNQIEAIATNDQKVSSSYGFCRNTTVSTVDNLPYWHDALSMLTIDGKIINNVDFEGGHLVVPDEEFPTGSLYGVRTYVPDVAKDFIDTYHDDDDTERFLMLRRYFGRHDVADEILVLEDSHHIYSLHMQTIIRDVMTGAKELAYDPDVGNMLLQVPEYAYLRPYDLAQPIRIQGTLTYDSQDITDITLLGNATWEDIQEQNRVIVKGEDIPENTTIELKDLTPGSEKLVMDKAATDSHIDIELEINRFDLRFLDVFLSYKDQEIDGREDRRAIVQLNKAILPEDSVTDGIFPNT